MLKFLWSGDVGARKRQRDKEGMKFNKCPWAQSLSLRNLPGAMGVGNFSITVKQTACVKLTPLWYEALLQVHLFCFFPSAHIPLVAHEGYSDMLRSGASAGSWGSCLQPHPLGSVLPSYAPTGPPGWRGGRAVSSINMLLAQNASVFRASVFISGRDFWKTRQ